MELVSVWVEDEEKGAGREDEVMGRAEREERGDETSEERGERGDVCVDVGGEGEEREV